MTENMKLVLFQHFLSESQLFHKSQIEENIKNSNNGFNEIKFIIYV